MSIINQVNNTRQTVLKWFECTYSTLSLIELRETRLSKNIKGNTISFTLVESVRFNLIVTKTEFTKTEL